MMEFLKAVNVRHSNIITKFKKSQEFMTSIDTDYIGLNEESQKNINQFLRTMAVAIIELDRGDRHEFFEGILAVLYGISRLNPLDNLIISKVLSLASSIMHAFLTDGNKVSVAVRKSIESAMDHSADSERIKDNTVTAYQNSFAFLINEGPFEEENIANEMPIYRDVEFLEILTGKIEENRESRDNLEALRAIEYTNIYVKLAILRTCMLEILHTAVKQIHDKERLATRIKQIIIDNQNKDKTLLTFLTKPDYSLKLVSVAAYPSPLPLVNHYLEYLNLESSRIGELGNFSFETKGISFGLTRSSWGFYNDGEMTCNDKDKDSEYFFYLSPVPRGDNLFYIQSKKEPHLYVFMRNSPFAQCYASKRIPGPEGQWQVKRLTDGRYIFSTQKWPEWFLKGIKREVLAGTGISNYVTFYHLTGDKTDYSKFSLKEALPTRYTN